MSSETPVPPPPRTPSPAAILVTGASRGLGRGIACALAGDGFDLAIHYASNRAAAEETMSACLAVAPRADQRLFLVGGDISRADDRERIVAKTLAALGRIDGLVNNAGVAPRQRADILEATEESFDEVVGVNLKGPYFLSQAVARHWLEHRGESRLPGGYRLLFVSSISATMASLNRGEYCISKAGLAMAAKLWATRLAAEGVQVFELRPGIMSTDMTAGVKEKYDRLIAEGHVPQGRWGTAGDLGLAVSALMKGSFPFSTGEVIHVDGGLHLERL
jgi:NAD(P)-dependent dehydrogenase (short-subunit alcohol dehydrogenase family)